MPWLSILIWSPALVALGCYFCSPRSVWPWRIAGSLLFGLFCCTLYLMSKLNTALHTIGEFRGYAFLEQQSWFSFPVIDGSLQVDYLLGVDGMSLPLVALSFLVFLIGLFVAYIKTPRVGAGFLSTYLLLLSGVVGAFCSIDLLLFFMFFELVALPIYLLIATYGGPRRTQAALQFIVYSLVGSVLLLTVVVGIYSSLSADVGAVHLNVFFYPQVFLQHGFMHADGGIWELFAFIALLAAFGIKLAVVPLHGWLPTAHVEASTPVSIVLAAVVLKLGGYALLRLGWSLFHVYMLDYGDILAWVGGITVAYGILNALGQQDLKRIIAYSSISHMGFVWLGAVSSMENGLIGSIYQMVSHGLVVTGLFVICDVLESRFSSRNVGDYSGLNQHMPWFAVLCTLFFFASFAIPGSAGFIAEFFVIMGFLEACVAQHLHWPVLLVLITGILLAAACWIWTFRNLFQGDFYITSYPTKPKDIFWAKRNVLILLAILIYLLGILPQYMLSIIYPAVQRIRVLIFMLGV